MTPKFIQEVLVTYQVKGFLEVQIQFIKIYLDVFDVIYFTRT